MPTAVHASIADPYQEFLEGPHKREAEWSENRKASVKKSSDIQESYSFEEAKKAHVVKNQQCLLLRSQVLGQATIL